MDDLLTFLMDNWVGLRHAAVVSIGVLLVWVLYRRCSGSSDVPVKGTISALEERHHERPGAKD